MAETYNDFLIEMIQNNYEMEYYSNYKTLNQKKH
jgi:hypothetical protein